MTKTSSDRYLGLTVGDGYRLKSFVGEGRVGRVYHAVSEYTGLTMACKVIREGGLKDGWQRELEKVRKLQGVDSVVQYYTHNTNYDQQNRPFHWVMFQYIDGRNLHETLADPQFSLTLPFVEAVLNTALNVLYACKEEDIAHGDLHAKNILIANPDRRIRNSSPKVYVGDFGYGGSHNDIAPKDDFQELANVIADMLRRLQPNQLNARDKILYAGLRDFVQKRLRDGGRTPSVDSASLLSEFDQLIKRAEKQSAAGAREEEEEKTPSDYLWAEALGYRAHEWRDLFVPDFLSANDLLAKTVTVLTGARGCGKTMSFRRMTKLMDALLEEGSGVRGADQFVGFYLNCRDLLDAFPWVPRTLRPSGEQQVIHFFHLAWIAEICKTLARVDLDEAGNYKWLQDLLLKHYAERFVPVVSGGRVLAHIRSFVEADKETCRKVPLGKTEGLASWPLARLDFLDELQQGMSEHIGWAANKPLYLFLDDYTIPLVPPKLQQALNPIIFKRRSEIFFKVSTEAANSFLAVGPNKKPLEIHHDFHLLDLASESLHQGAVEKEAMLDRIFKPRIKRYSAFSACDYGLADVLGKTPYDYNELAWQMRSKDDKKKIYYFGKKVFVGLWTSDIRIMVEMFSDMLREGNGKLAAQNCEIAREVQDRCIRAQGGEMMTFTQSVRDPELSKRSGGNNVPGESFGLHLKSIVEAFINVSKHELMKGALVKNEGHTNPKQAFRLEVVDSFEPTTKGRAFLAGLVRYHIFLQDWRGKSQRGMLTPRLYLNRIFLPHAGLTLSSHDNIRVKNQELTLLLETPHEFYEYWRKKKGSNDAQTSFCV